MKTNLKQNQGPTEREQILRSAVASFKIEGITISPETAKAALKKVEATLEKRSR